VTGDYVCFFDEPTRLRPGRHAGGSACLAHAKETWILITLSPATAADSPFIEDLLDARFGPARQKRTAYRLRDGAAPLAELCLVARDGERLIGSVQCWPLQLRAVDGRRYPLMLLGPVAVALAHERLGIGGLMVSEVVARADAAGLPPMLLIGDAPYYGRFGFSADKTAHWQVPGPVDRARLLLRGGADDLPALGWLEPVTKDRVAA
jgi:predicted N-acetyltransferase YhbS